MRILKRKQIVVLSLVIMILAAGYLQYTYRASSISISDRENGQLGGAVYVEDDGAVINQDTVPASKEANDFFVQAKLEKEVTRGKDTEALKALSEGESAGTEMITQANEKMITIIDNSQKEMRIETMIKDKGFADSVVLFGDDGSVDVIVKSPTLTQAHVAQITDLVTRQANLPIDKIYISNKY